MISVLRVKCILWAERDVKICLGLEHFVTENKNIKLNDFKILDMRVFERPKFQNTWKGAFHGRECECFEATFLYFLLNRTKVLKLLYKCVLFWCPIVTKPVGQFFFTKNSQFWAKNGQINKKLPFLIQKCPFFWPKKCRTGLLNLTYHKSTHLCYNLKKLA